MQNRRGRPPIGKRISVRLPPELPAEALERAQSSGVDVAQMQRMLRMTPRQRIQHVAAATNQLQRLQRAVRQ